MFILRKASEGHDRRMKIAPITAALSLFVASIAFADQGTVVRLTPAEIEAAQAAGMKAHLVTPDPVNDIIIPKRTLHGEMGMMVGTGGTRAVYGTMVAPLGSDGILALSFADGIYGNYGRRVR